MPATVRYDAQYCPIARALDVLGDRWTLLILRDLVVGDQRFTDLRRNLRGIAPTVLTQRLAHDDRAGLDHHRRSPRRPRASGTGSPSGAAARRR